MQIAERMGRLGTETAFDVLARAGALQAAGRSIINLGIGQPDFRTPDHIVEAGRKALADGHHGYTPANGIPALREAVAADIATYRHCEVDPDNVVVVPGGKVTMFFAALMFGEPGAEILYPNPGFPIYESAIKFSGATPVPIPLYEETGFSFDADEVLAKITPRTRLVMLNSPANPTGGVVPRETFDRLAQGLEAHPHVAIMSDEIYSRLLYEGREHVTMLDYPALRDRVIVLDGWSKTYAMTGWRIGYGVWPASLAAHATRLAINCNSCVNAPTQHAALAALTGPQESVEIMRRTFDERRRQESSSPHSTGSRASPASIPPAPSTPCPISLAPGSTRGRCRTGCWRKPASPPSPAPASAPMGRATSASPTPRARKRSRSPSPALRPGSRSTRPQLEGVSRSCRRG